MEKGKENEKEQDGGSGQKERTCGKVNKLGERMEERGKKERLRKRQIW